jgi:hypothetical protein
MEKGTENEFYTKNNWIKNFSEYKTIWQKDVGGAIKVQKRQL